MVAKDRLPCGFRNEITATLGPASPPAAGRLGNALLGGRWLTAFQAVCKNVATRPPTPRTTSTAQVSIFPPARTERAARSTNSPKTIVLPSWRRPTTSVLRKPRPSPVVESPPSCRSDPDPLARDGPTSCPPLGVPRWLVWPLSPRTRPRISAWAFAQRVENHSSCPSSRKTTTPATESAR